MPPSSPPSINPLTALNRRIVACQACPRLLAHCQGAALGRRRAYAAQDYWGRPVPSFGDPDARLLVVGLAPGAHGANRTGRVFTGDSSGDWLFDALHRTGFANQPTSRSREDGLELTGTWITAINHCAPPDNKATPEEQAACRPFLVREMEILTRVRVIVPLGRIAWDGWFRAMADCGHPTPRPRPAFGHGVEYTPFGPAGPILLGSYHPSRHNTNTGRLTRLMWQAVFDRARQLVDGLGDPAIP